MRSNISVNIVSAHAEGEVGNVIVGGIPDPPGNDLWEMRTFIEKDQKLRNLLLNVPRGGVFKHINLLVKAKHPNAEFGFIIMEPNHTPPMSGLIKIEEPITSFNLDTPAGLIRVRATCRDGEALKIEIQNVESFVDQLNVPLKINGLGTLTVNTAFGGDSFVLVNASDCGLKIEPKSGDLIRNLGKKIIKAANEQLGFKHPVKNWNHISFCQFTDPTMRTNNVLTGLSAVVIEPGKIDRSPCGTGCSARMALLVSQGKMKKEDTFVGKSIIGGSFECNLKEIKNTDRKQSIIPKICGRGYITGTHQIMRNPSDPWPYGYRVSDTWPN